MKWLFIHIARHYYFAILKVEVCIIYKRPILFYHQTLQASMWTVDHWKSGCPVEVKHRCHIRLLGSTNLVDLMTSDIGKYTLCVLQTPVVMPLNPANAPWTCKITGKEGRSCKIPGNEVDWQQGESVIQRSDQAPCIG
jgi:hypothetical protein